MPRNVFRLTDRQVRTLSRRGRHADGGSLYLQVQSANSKSWLFLRKKGVAKPSWHGLGAYPDVTLAMAREKAAAARRAIADGRDPFEHRKEPKDPTFAEVVDLFLDDQRKAGWKSAPYRRQWTMTLGDAYCAYLRPKRVSTITTADVLVTLKPAWLKRPVTASQLRGRVERVLAFAKTSGWRSGENPAAWRDNLKELLVDPKKLAPVKHHEAMPYTKLPAFMGRLRSERTLSSLAMQLLILTAGRMSEVTGARWSEVDLETATWTVPGSRMKGAKDHTVPLPMQVLRIIDDLAKVRCDDFLFPGRPGRPLTGSAMDMLLRRLDEKPATLHGFRSSFRDWAGDETHHARETIEAALAHKVGGVEGAYRRASAIAKRRQLMQAWGDFCDGVEGKVVHLHAADGRN